MNEMTLDLAEGPLLETLTRRLAETPPDFLAEPRIGGAGQVHVGAVVSDLLVELGGESLDPGGLATFQGARFDAARLRAWLGLVLVSAWLLREDWFHSHPGLAPQARRFLGGAELKELARTSVPEGFTSEPDLREELARRALRGLGLRPAGESQTQAEDRLNALDSIERVRVLAAARQAEERTREVLRQMAAKKTQEAADKWSRE